MTEKTISAQEAVTVNPKVILGEDVMGFLNEIQLKYPQAVSFASGRPDERFFDISGFHQYLLVFAEHIARMTHEPLDTVLRSLGQYNKTKGIISEALVKFLSIDEKIHVQPKDILVTVGTQEGIAMVLTALCDTSTDSIVIEEPTYVGVTHFARIQGYEIVPVKVGARGLCLETLKKHLEKQSSTTKTIKLVYVTPDYQNPTGTTMPLEERQELLRLAGVYNFLIVEDNAYGDFGYEQERLPALKSLDTQKRVIYLRSFSKTLYPSLRLSVMVADQEVEEKGQKTPLSDILARVKGYITVNTPALLQAMLGGILITHDYSLTAVTREKVIAMKVKRDEVVRHLEHFIGRHKESWAKNITWQIPAGGFFITLTTPFSIDKKDVLECAANYGAIFTPMSFFHADSGGEHQLRLAFSYVSENDIPLGIEKLSEFLKNKALTS
ncbi:PLP-dependent aminotransferase family protein [Ascidiimonas aurantiaca]|uniref:aminotransferase-like domain-containing protein n=1 Tax=Ascidiimonas aurantiaca TaxID=1685432 RepID=UPI0030EB83B1